MWGIVETLLIVGAILFTFLFGFKFGVEWERNREVRKWASDDWKEVNR